MNPIIERFGPPAVVLGITVYLGWAPAEPLDLGDDLVRAKTVRWKSEDLNAPARPSSILKDPFAEVLVKAPVVHDVAVATTEPAIAETPTAEAAPVVSAPVVKLTENDLLMGLRSVGLRKQISDAGQLSTAVSFRRAIRS